MLEIVSYLRALLAPIILAVPLVACGDSDPGPLGGTWQVTGLVPMAIQFRRGETEALGVIEKVSYEKIGADVIVTYESGLMKGSAMRFSMTGPDSARSDLGRLQRLK